MSDLEGWTRRPTPGLAVLQGRQVRLEPLDWDQHGEGLFAAIGGASNASLWDWMPVGPFLEPDALGDFLLAQHSTEGWRTLVIRLQAGGEIRGSATYMRIREAHGSAEIGCVAFGQRLRRSREASEALTLMASHVFDLGYRRYEWKCNTQNLASMRAAARFGFGFEGVFRNDMVIRGKSRDTAWFSIVDREWPALHAALERWLADDNFANDGLQKRTLESFRAG